MELVSKQDEVDQQMKMAHFLGSKGFKVLPVTHPVKDKHGEIVCSCGNSECSKIGKHPCIQKWNLRASSEKDQIDRWWSEFPDANIGLVTGRGLLVVDIDPRNGGEESFNNLEQIYGTLPPTVTVCTGGGGLHLYFSYEPTLDIRCGTNILGDGIDIKGDRGYVVAPQSIHESGEYYYFKDGMDPESIPIANAPSWLLDLIQDKRKRSLTRVDSEKEPIIIQGQRNTTLTQMAGTLRGSGMDASVIAITLKTINQRQCFPPLPELEVEEIASSIGTYQAGNSINDSGITDTVRLGLSELGNAKRLVKRFQGSAHYCFTRDKWLVYDGTRWTWDDKGSTTNIAKKTVESISNEVPTLCKTKDEENKLLKHAARSLSASHITNIIKLAQTEEDIPIDINAFDTDPWLFNLENGTIDLRTGHLRAHSERDLIIKKSPVTYDEKAECPIFMKFLNRIFEGNEDIIPFLQKLVGYSMTGLTDEQKIGIMYGTGANGKSTLIGVLMSLFGDYAKTPASDTFLKQQTEKIRNDLAFLVGARLVCTDEVEHGKFLSESLIKSITGGEEITARFLHKEYFSFLPEFQIFMATNSKPRITGRDKGIWRRIWLIPFNICIEEKEQDKNLAQKLKMELPGILNWAIEGCMEWQRKGLDCPDVVKYATEEYQNDMDILADFIENRCVIGDKNIYTASQELYQAYVKWSEKNSQHPISMPNFKSLLEQKDFKQKRKGTSRCWVGIALKSDYEASEAMEGFDLPDNTKEMNKDKKDETLIIENNGTPNIDNFL